MFLKTALFFFVVNLFCVGDSSKYSDFPRYETADSYVVVKFTDDSGDIKVAKLVEVDARIQQTMLFATETLIKIFNEAGCSIALVERFEDAGDKIVLIYPFKGNVIHQNDLTREQIGLVVLIMAKIHNLRLGEQTVKIPRSMHSTNAYSMRMLLFTDNSFFKKHILDTFLIERTQEACNKDESLLAAVNKAWFNQGGDVTEEIRPEFWNEIELTGISKDKIMLVLNDFIEHIDSKNFDNQDEREELQVVSHCNFEAQNIVWDENGEPTLVGNSNVGHINPHSEIIRLALTLAGFYHQQENVDLDKFKFMLAEYQKNTPSFGSISKDKVLNELEIYLFDVAGTKLRMVNLLEALKTDPHGKCLAVAQSKVQVQISLRKLLNSFRFFSALKLDVAKLFK